MTWPEWFARHFWDKMVILGPDFYQTAPDTIPAWIATLHNATLDHICIFEGSRNIGEVT